MLILIRILPYHDGPACMGDQILVDDVWREWSHEDHDKTQIQPSHQEKPVLIGYNVGGQSGDVWEQMWPLEMGVGRTELTCNKIRISIIMVKGVEFGPSSARIREMLKLGLRSPAILLVEGFHGCFYCYPHPFDYIPSRMVWAEKPGPHL